MWCRSAPYFGANEIAPQSSLDNVGAKIIGVVLNAMDLKKEGYYYYGSYYAEPEKADKPYA